MLQRYVSTDAAFIRSARCPRCSDKGADRSGDNLAIYSDGHAYCFSCKFYDKGYAPASLATASSSYSGLSVRTAQTRAGTKEDGRSYQTLATGHGEALKYLKKYGITASEIETYGIELTDDSVTFHFEQEDGGKLVQTRRFLPDGTRQFKTKGSSKKLRKVWGVKECMTVVVVEDPISAIKVGRKFATYPVVGSNIDGNALQSLATRFSEVGIWLDSDKRSEALSACFKGWQWNPRIRPVFTSNDPKDYTELIIEEVVQEALKE